MKQTNQIGSNTDIITALFVLSVAFLTGGYRFEGLCLIETIIIFAWLIWVISQKRLCIVKSSIHLPVLFFLLAHLLSTLTSLCPRSSFEALTKIITSILLYLLIIHYLYQSEIRLKWLMFSLLLTASLVSAISFASFLSTFSGIDSFNTRCYIPLGNPNILSSFLVINIPLLICSLSLFKLRLSRILIGLVIGISLFILMLTYSRGGWLGLSVALVTLAFLQSNTKRIKLLACLSIFLIGITILLACLNKLNWNLFIEPKRLFIWQSAWKMFLQHPISGIGINAFGSLFLDYRILTWHPHSHNLFLQTLSEMGLIGFLSLLWLLITFFKEAFSNYRRLAEEKRGILAGLIASMVGLLVHHQVDYILWIPLIGFYFWLIIALVIGLTGKTTPALAQTNISTLLTRVFKVTVVLFWLCCIFKPYQGYLAFNQGILEANKSKYYLAITNFKKAILLDSHPLYHNHLAICYLKIKQLRLAQEEDKKVFQIDPFFWKHGGSINAQNRGQLLKNTFCKENKELIWMLYRRRE